MPELSMCITPRGSARILRVAIAHQLLHNIAQFAGAFAEAELAADVDDRDAVPPAECWLESSLALSCGSPAKPLD